MVAESNVAIPLVDLHAQHVSIQDEVNAAIQSVIADTTFVLGPAVIEFERTFASYCGVTEAVGLDSGISALELGMRALGIGPGDEVITPANSFIASSSAISFTGATPVWVDMDPVTYNLDPNLVERLITPRTKAIMPVHLYGQPAELTPILDLARAHNLRVVEDACQAHGALYQGRRVGSWGDFGAFSFYPGKNLGAYGDGGALVTSDPDLAERVRMMRNYGQRRKYDHVFLAWNRRLDSIQAAVLSVKLTHLDVWNDARRTLASLYDELLPSVLVRPQARADHVYHVYVVQVDRRGRIEKQLADRGIATGIHYPIPIHLQKAYRQLGFGPGSFPASEQVANRILSLPMYPELGVDGVRRVAEAVDQAISA